MKFSRKGADEKKNLSMNQQVHAIYGSHVEVKSFPDDSESGDCSRDYSRSALGHINKVFSRGTYIGALNILGKPNGRGVMRFNDGSIYDGEWQNSVMTGIGTCTFSDGISEYRGEWKNGNPDGHGCFNYPNGDTYDGSWRNGEMNGLGIYMYLNSEVYDGKWKHNKQHGYGKFIHRGGNIFNGQWRQGKREGNGILKHTNGDEFAGEYVDDRKDGLGVYRRKNGELDIGIYSDYVHTEGVRFSSDRTKAWELKSDAPCKVTSIRNAETFRENAMLVSPFLAHYLREYY